LSGIICAIAADEARYTGLQFQCASPHWLKLQDLAHKVLRPVHRLAGKAHLVRDDGHGHPVGDSTTFSSALSCGQMLIR
jgi:hypothetical protein